MLKQGNRIVALGTLTAMTMTAFVGAGTAEASTKGKRNLTIGLGAVTAYGIVKKKRTVAIAGGVGTALAYRSYKKSKKRDQRHSRLWYQQRYGRNWRNHYPG